jgi:hypothetical protein
LIAFNGPKKIQVEGWNEVSAGILLSVNMKKMKKRKRISTKKAFGEEGKAVRL